MRSGGNVAAWIYTGLEHDLGPISGYTRKAPHPVFGSVDVKVYETSRHTLLYQTGSVAVSLMIVPFHLEFGR